MKSVPFSEEGRLKVAQAAQPHAGPLGMMEVLRFRTMRRLWYAQVVSAFGDFLILFAIITIMTFKLRATPQQVTGIQIAYMLPIALLGIVSGVFVDRWSIKPTLVISDFTRAALCLLMLLVHSVYGFYAVLATISIFSSFFSPAQGVAILSAVPAQGLRSANALMQQVMFVMRIVGGPIATLIVTHFNQRICYMLDSLSFLASGALIASLSLAARKEEPAQTFEIIAKEKRGLARIGEDMKEGASFIFHHSALSFVITAMAAAMFVMGCFGPLIAIFVRDTLHASTNTFGFASAMIGVGLLAGVTVLSAAAKNVSNTVLVYSGLGGIACGTLLMAAAPHVVTTILGCLLIGFAAGGIIVPAQTLIQGETPPAMVGRVGSTVTSITFGAQIAGLILSGILAQHISVRGVFALCTLMMVLLILAGKVWLSRPSREGRASTVIS